MTNKDIAKLLEHMALLLELKGENPFRVRAYERAARVVESHSTPINSMSMDDLLELQGIGKDLAGKITEAAQTGSMHDLDALKATLPAGLLDIVHIPGVGPKTTKLLYDKRGISDLDALEHAARTGGLDGLPGIKEKTVAKILKGIELVRKGRERRALGIMRPLAMELVTYLQSNAPMARIAIAGSLRRWKDTAKDMDILCTSSQPVKVMETFVSSPLVADVIAHGDKKSSVMLHEGIQADLRVVDEEAYGSALAYFTGSKEHNVRLREAAQKIGLKINEYGVYRELDQARIGGEHEQDIYRALGMDFVPPELREDTGEVEAARSHSLPQLVTLEDIKGDLHMHTTRSDGANTIEELIHAAKARGYSYIAITNHSRGLSIAGGMSEESLMQEIAEIDAINKKLRGFRVLKGIEVDIKSDLTLDFPDEVLSKLDVVVASIHSGFTQPRQKLMARFEVAMSNPHVHIIAHPTGRLIGQRDAYDIDISEVIAMAARTGTALEINAHPSRLDLCDTHARAASVAGVGIVISTDAHHYEQFALMEYGVATARRGWLTKEKVLNTLNVNGFLKSIAMKAKQA